MNAVAGELLKVVLDHILTQDPIEQSGEATYAHKLEPADFFFNSESTVLEVDRKVRAASLIKGAWTEIGGEKFRVHQAGKIISKKIDATRVGTLDRNGQLNLNDGAIELLKVQMPGKPVLEFASWVNGVPADKFPLKIDS